MNYIFKCFHPKRPPKGIGDHAGKASHRGESTLGNKKGKNRNCNGCEEKERTNASRKKEASQLMKARWAARKTAAGNK